MLCSTEGPKKGKRGPKKGTPRRGFGRIRTERSGRISAAYVGPDGELHRAATTFEDEDTARAWLVQEKRLIQNEDWTPPADRAKFRQMKGQTFGEFAEDWLANRQVKGRPIKQRTKDHYQDLLNTFILPAFEDKPLRSITPDAVDAWYRSLDPKRPTYRAHAYSLLRTILGSVDRAILPANPAAIRGAGNTRRRHHVEPLSLDELAALTQAMPENRRLMVLLAAWCAMRFGELAELRRSDIDMKNQLVKVRRGVVRTSEGVKVGSTKSDAGARNIAIPPHLMPTVKAHLADHTEPGRDALLFPSASGGHLAPSTFYGREPKKEKVNGVEQYKGGHGYYKARAVAGRPDAHFHDLRHTGAVLAAQTGATLAELMARLGHSTPAAAMRYQHAARDRDTAIAAALSKMVEGGAQ